MAKRKQKRNGSRSKAAAGAKEAVAKKGRKPRPAKQPRESSQTWGDYIGMSLSPILIILMVGSLLNFLVATFYRGFYAQRLYLILWAFSLAVVLVSRISITSGQVRATIYGIALAIVTGLAINTYLENPLIAIPLTIVVWWCAKKMTWDCTLINDEEDASGEGLLQHTGFEKRLEPVENRVPIWKRFFVDKSSRENEPHAPGVWILYFSFAAIPVFGLGQFLIEVDGPDRVGAANRAFTFKLLMFYIMGAMTLLLVTSLLGLRRYLRQRGVQMPMGIVWTWIGTGGALILFLLLGSYFLPRPDLLADFGPISKWSDIKMGTDYLDDDDSLFKLGYGTEEDDPDIDPNMLLDIPLVEDEEEIELEPPPPKPNNNKSKSQQDKEELAQQDPEEQKPPEEVPPQPEEPPQEDKLLADATPPPETEPDPPVEKPAPDEEKPTTETPATPDPNGDLAAMTPPEETAPAETTPPDEEPESPTPPEEKKPKPEPEPEAKPPEPEPEVQTAEFDWFWWLMLLLILLAIAAIGYLLYRYNESVRGFLQSLWQMLFGKKKKEDEEEESGDEVEVGDRILVLTPPDPPAPFRTFRNPFEEGSINERKNSEVVCYTFDALESWAHEHQQERPPEQTPMEFCYELERKNDRFQNSAKQLSRWYTSYAYADREPDDSCRPELEHVWEVMLKPETEPEILEADEADTAEFPAARE